jgi:uncharacterized protein (TIGR03083 family)
MSSFAGTKESTLEALEFECALVSEVVTGLSESDFGLATRCAPWDVKVLLGHLWRGVGRIVEYAVAPEPATADDDAVTYWRAYDPIADGAKISAGASEVADRFGAGPELARSFDEHRRACVEAARGMDGGRLVSTRFTTIRLDEFLATRVLEMAVHGLDLAAALGRRPWITIAGAEITCSILTGLLGGSPPAALGWGDVAFIEIGTGRRDLAESERRVVGGAAERFPLLG